MMTSNMGSFTLVGLVAMAAGAGFGTAHAATATSSPIPIVMNVNSPVCEVTPSAANILLPEVASPTVQWKDYLTANQITLPVPGGDATWRMSAGLDQTATISCTTENVPILSFVVRPHESADVNPSFTAWQYLTDATPGTPVRLAGDVLMSALQMQVNGAPASVMYSTLQGSLSKYTTVFTTGPLNGTRSEAQCSGAPCSIRPL